MFVLQTKYKSFLNIFMLQKKIFLIIKNIFVKTSINFGNTQSVVFLKLALRKT